MLMICSKAISNAPKGFQQSLHGIYKHAQKWKLKVNTKKSNIIIFSGNRHLVVKPMQGKFLARRLLKQSPQLNNYPRTLILQWSIWSVNETVTQQVSQSVSQSFKSVSQQAACSSISQSVGWSVNRKSAIQSVSESIDLFNDTAAILN